MVTGKGEIARVGVKGHAEDRKVQIVRDRTAKKERPGEGRDYIVLTGIHFKTLSDQIQESPSRAELARLLDFMWQNPTVAVRIEVRMDDFDTVYENGRSLAEERGFRLRAYLGTKGIPWERLMHTTGHALTPALPVAQRPPIERQNNPPILVAVVTR